MKKYGTALWDKYLPAAIFCLLWACCAQAQTLQPVSAWGYKWNRGLFTTAFGIPKDTAVLNAEQKQFPHIAYKGENRYRWSVQQQKWVDDGASGSPVDSMAFRKDSVFIFNSDTVYYVGSIDTLYIHSIIENYTRDSVFTYHDSLIIQRDSIFIYNTTRDTTYFIGEVDPSLGNKVDSVTFGTSPYVDTVKYWVNGTATIAGYINKPQGCVDSDGGIVVYRQGTLIADVSPKPFYCINGEQYSFTGGTVTHDAADATNPRYDWVVLNTSGGVQILKGPASENPSPGVVDETLYKPLTFILIVPTGTTPADLDPELPYDENTGEPDEWTTSTTIPGANFNATAQVFSGTKSTTILGWANGQYLKYLNDADVARSRFTSFSFRLWLTANMSKQQNISVQFWKDNTAVSNQVPAIINKTTLNAYQLVAFDMGQFTFTQQEFDEARLIFSGSSASTIYIDRVEFQGLPGGSGGGTTSPPLVITDGTTNVTVKTPLKFRGDGKVTFTVGSNTTHGDFVLGQINVDSLTGQPITNITGLQDALDARVIDVKWYTGTERDTMVVEFTNGEQLRYVTPVNEFNEKQFVTSQIDNGHRITIKPTPSAVAPDSVLWIGADSTLYQSPAPSGGGGSGTFAGLTDVTFSSPPNNTVWAYKTATSKLEPQTYVPIVTTGALDGNYFIYDSINQQLIPSSIAGTGTNIYNSNGTLTSDRILSHNSYALRFRGGSRTASSAGDSSALILENNPAYSNGSIGISFRNWNTTGRHWQIKATATGGLEIQDSSKAFKLVRFDSTMRTYFGSEAAQPLTHSAGYPINLSLVAHGGVFTGFLRVQQAAATSTGTLGIELQALGTENYIDAYSRQTSAFLNMNYRALLHKFGTGPVLINKSSSDGSNLQVAGSISTALQNRTLTYTALATDRIINYTDGTVTINLPTAVGITGRDYIIKNSGTGVITVDASGTQTIDGALTYSLSTQYQYVQVVSDGANWIIIGKN